jgi:hypothetical protein
LRGREDTRENLARIAPKPKEGAMCRRIVTTIVVVAILPAGWLLSDRAEAEASASPPSKYPGRHRSTRPP